MNAIWHLYLSFRFRIISLNNNILVFKVVTVLVACIQWFVWESSQGALQDISIKVQVLLLVVLGSLLYNTNSTPAK
jgi:hypothetical protein